jgi:hypothetical protein
MLVPSRRLRAPIFMSPCSFPVTTLRDKNVRHNDMVIPQLRMEQNMMMPTRRRLMGLALALLQAMGLSTPALAHSKDLVIFAAPVWMQPASLPKKQASRSPKSVMRRATPSQSRARGELRPASSYQPTSTGWIISGPRTRASTSSVMIWF